MAGWPAHQSIEESQRILNSFIQHHKTFALELKSNHKVIGSLGIEAYQITLNEELEQKKGRELGYVLNKEYWGQGLMPEAVKAVIDYCFTELKLDFLICAHFKRNHQSQRVIEKCGFKFLKTANYQTLLKTIEESNYYLLLKEDYFRRSN